MLKELNKAIAQQLIERNGEVLQYILNHFPRVASYDDGEYWRPGEAELVMTNEGGRDYPFMPFDSDDFSSGEGQFQHGFPHYGFENI